jgi:CheY-like chemotaxis protein
MLGIRVFCTVSSPTSVRSGPVTIGAAMKIGNCINNRPTILVVEDVEETRDGIEQLLKSDGYSVHSARHEDEAVTKAARDHPNLILVSLGPSRSDIPATARTIRSRAHLLPTVPIVIFCSPTLDEGAELAIGESTYMIRPDNFDQLRTLLHRLLY